jgi:hypothetical protein
MTSLCGLHRGSETEPVIKLANYQLGVCPLPAESVNERTNNRKIGGCRNGPDNDAYDARVRSNV